MTDLLLVVAIVVCCCGIIIALIEMQKAQKEIEKWEAIIEKLEKQLKERLEKRNEQR